MKIRQIYYEALKLMYCSGLAYYHRWQFFMVDALGG